MTRMDVAAQTRAAAVQLMSDYASFAELKMQIYRARVKQAKPPTGYVESIDEAITPFTLETSQRVPTAVVRLLWGRFDDGDAVDQRDAFVDGFYAWVMDNPHAIDPNAIVGIVAVSDDPDFVLDGVSYFSSSISLEGLAST